MTSPNQKRSGDSGPVILEADFVAGAASDGQLPPPSLGEIAFAGRSNVGKSSLLNRLVLRRGLVRTGSTPGTTRQINMFRVKTQDELELLLVDLPGYGYAKRSKSEQRAWATLIEGYLRGRVTLRALVLLVDVRRGVEEDDLELLTFLRQPDPRVSRPAPGLLVVATKIDRLGASERKPAFARIAAATDLGVTAFSAETGEGREELWRRIRSAALREP